MVEEVFVGRSKELEGIAEQEINFEHGAHGARRTAASAAVAAAVCRQACQHARDARRETVPPKRRVKIAVIRVALGCDNFCVVMPALGGLSDFTTAGPVYIYIYRALVIFPF